MVIEQIHGGIENLIYFTWFPAGASADQQLGHHNIWNTRVNSYFKYKESMANVDFLNNDHLSMVGGIMKTLKTVVQSSHLYHIM